jgi:predicted O-methyltransferase YrrM
MKEKGGFANFEMIPAGESGLMRDLFVGWKHAKPARIPPSDQNSPPPSSRPAPVSSAPASDSSDDDPHYYVRLREFVQAQVPPAGNVLVISKGDDGLLQLPNRRAGHFPQNLTGGYPGHHPAGSDEAITDLERLRKQGAEFLFIPYTAAWWLDYYKAFSRHLDQRFRRVAHTEKEGVIFDLRTPRAGAEVTADPPAPPIRWTTLVTSLQAYAARGEATEELAKLIAPLLRRYLAPGVYEEFFAFWEQHGFHLAAVHPYDPLPDTRDLPARLWRQESALAGIDFNLPGQLELLENAFPAFRAEYDNFPTAPTGKPGEFYLYNGMFDGTDALALYCMVRHFQPKLILEVGSGFSSCVSAQAALENGHTRLVCVEPNPGNVLRQGFEGLSALISKPVQAVGLEEFEALEANDILFIDSSHVIKLGNDLHYLFLEVIPRLKPGVLVHFHDIFLPHEYPEVWVKKKRRFWNEQYLLQTFLAFNSAFEVLQANHYLGRNHRARMQITYPRSPWWGGGSFWMRRRLEDKNL